MISTGGDDLQLEGVVSTGGIELDRREYGGGAEEEANEKGRL